MLSVNRFLSLLVWQKTNKTKKAECVTPLIVRLSCTSIPSDRTCPTG